MPTERSVLEELAREYERRANQAKAARNGRQGEAGGPNARTAFHYKGEAFKTAARLVRDRLASLPSEPEDGECDCDHSGEAVTGGDRCCRCFGTIPVPAEPGPTWPPILVSGNAAQRMRETDGYLDADLLTEVCLYVPASRPQGETRRYVPASEFGLWVSALRWAVKWIEHCQEVPVADDEDERDEFLGFAAAKRLLKDVELANQQQGATDA